MNRTDQIAEYLRVESKFGVDHLLKCTRQRKWQGILALGAASIALDAAIGGFGGGYALSVMFTVLFFRESYRVFQVRERRMAGLIEFLGSADQWWPRLPTRLADMDGPTAAEAPADAAQLTHLVADFPNFAKFR